MTLLPSFAVLGFGTMGVGIAQVLAASGRSVRVLEASSERLADGFAALEASLDAGVSRGKLNDDDRRRASELISAVDDVYQLTDVAAVVEALPEDFELKVAVLNAVAEKVSSSTPLLTNTSALSVTELAARLPHPERVAGLHFFNPPPAMRLVEVVAAVQTAPELVAQLEALVGSMDKEALSVADRPGFLVNALLLPYLNDVVREYDAGLATAEDIDVALQLGLGYRTGPLEMLDVIGLDVHLNATSALYRATGDSRYAPPPLLQRMVSAGHLGAKSGIGFRVGVEER